VTRVEQLERALETARTILRGAEARLADDQETVQRWREKVHRLHEQLEIARTEPPAAPELVYAATVRCRCGAGLAYPEGAGLRDSWSCSAVLLGADPAGHDEDRPFTFWEIKSERQPSANGATTRPTR